MAVRQIAEQDVIPLRPVVDAPPIVEPEPAPIPEDTKAQDRTALLLSMSAAIQLAAKVLCARLVLMLIGIGAFVLALIVVQHASVAGIVASAIYDICVFVPAMWLALQKG